MSNTKTTRLQVPMCSEVNVRYSCGHKGQHLCRKPCYRAQMIEAYSKPDSKVILQNSVEYYHKECENCSSEEYVKKKKVCGVCVLAAKGLQTVQEEDEEEGDETLADLERAYGSLGEVQTYSWLD